MNQEAASSRTMTPQTSSVHHAFVTRFILPVLLLLLQAWRGSCHPQCLDYKPPFEPLQPLVFCKEYSKFGCCDVEKDEELAIRYYKIMENFDHSGYMTCGRYLRSILCQVRGPRHHSHDENHDGSRDPIGLLMLRTIRGFHALQMCLSCKLKVLVSKVQSNPLTELDFSALGLI